MAGKRQAEQPPERRIIRRSRLLAALSATDARTILLIAPAGYGKTTLARQWLEETGGVWVTVTEASGDIPVLARDLSAAVASLTRIDPSRIEAALNSGRSPEDQARKASRAIVSQIDGPVDGWIVIDDYQLLMRSRAAEEFIAALERSKMFKFVVTTRERPSLATPRRRVYLETFELDAKELALDDEEVTELLPPDRRTTVLRRQARGWPAVLGLAAYAHGADLPPTVESLSAALYEFLAEELFDNASAEVRRGLTALAVLPPLRLNELLAFAEVGETARQLPTSGLAYESDGLIEVHPLARDFLLAKLRDRTDSDLVARSAFDFAVKQKNFDHAFVLAREFGLDEFLERLITASYFGFVTTGRIATLAELGRYASTRPLVRNSLTDLISAEVALIGSEYVRAHALGISAANSLPSDHCLKARGSLIAGRAGLFLHQYEDAFALFERAAEQATTVDDANEASWGKCAAAFELGDERMLQAVHELESLESPRLSDRVRLEIARSHLALVGQSGRLRNDHSDAARLLPQVTDPWVSSAWEYRKGHLLVLQARYYEARQALKETEVELTKSGLEFAVPHASWSIAAAELGLRHFLRCAGALRRVERGPEYGSGIYFQLNIATLRARMLLAQQQPADALKMLRSDYPDCPIPTMYGEYLATRAVALAVLRRRAASLIAADRAEELTQYVDVRILCAGARLILASERDATRTALSLLKSAAEFDVWDPVVCCARASPLALKRLASVPEHRAELGEVLLRANDARLAKMAGLVTRVTGSGGVLTVREREIMDHVMQGMTNRGIAASLFISSGTVKSHLDHIFQKLGVRTRAEAVARYAEMENADTEES